MKFIPKKLVWLLIAAIVFQCSIACHAKNITDYYLELVKHFCNPERTNLSTDLLFSANDPNPGQFQADNLHGYLTVNGGCWGGELIGGNGEFALFLRKGNSPLLAVNMASNSQSNLIQIYDLENWKNKTMEVFPKISMEFLFKRMKEKEECRQWSNFKVSDLSVDFNLPRIGTTIAVLGAAGDVPKKDRCVAYEIAFNGKNFKIKNE